MELGLLIITCGGMIAALLANKLGALPPQGRLDQLSTKVIGTLQVITVLFLLWRGRFDLLAIFLVTAWAVVMPYVKRGERLFWTGTCAVIGVLGWILQIVW